jgi:vacuolar protein sorting-associated protein 35
MELDDIFALHVSLINLAIKCYSDELGYVDKALGYCTELLNQKDIKQVESNTSAGRELQRLMKVPTDSYDDILTVLKLQNYLSLFLLFDYNGRHSLSVHLLQNVLEKDAKLSTLVEVESLFELLSPLLKDQDDQPSSDGVDEEDFLEEQIMMARLIHLFKAPLPDNQYQIINAARKIFGAGGDKRIIHTLPPLIFATYRLITSYKLIKDTDSKWLAKCEKIFQFVLQTISVLSKNIPELSLRLYLQGALSADGVRSEAITYEFLTQVIMTAGWLL